MYIYICIILYIHIDFALVHIHFNSSTRGDGMRLTGINKDIEVVFFTHQPRRIAVGMIYRVITNRECLRVGSREHFW